MSSDKEKGSKKLMQKVSSKVKKIRDKQKNKGAEDSLNANILTKETLESVKTTDCSTEKSTTGAISSSVKTSLNELEAAVTGVAGNPSLGRGLNKEEMTMNTKHEPVKTEPEIETPKANTTEANGSAVGKMSTASSSLLSSVTGTLKNVSKNSVDTGASAVKPVPSGSEETVEATEKVAKMLPSTATLSVEKQEGILGSLTENDVGESGGTVEREKPLLSSKTVPHTDTAEDGLASKVDEGTKEANTMKDGVLEMTTRIMPQVDEKHIAAPKSKVMKQPEAKNVGERAVEADKKPEKENEIERQVEDVERGLDLKANETLAKFETGLESLFEDLDNALMLVIKIKKEIRFVVEGKLKQ